MTSLFRKIEISGDKRSSWRWQRVGFIDSIDIAQQNSSNKFLLKIIFANNQNQLKVKFPGRFLIIHFNRLEMRNHTRSINFATKEDLATRLHLIVV